MQKIEVKAFKNELRNYTYLCYVISTLENSIEYCYDRLGGVRGIDPSKEPTHSQPNKELEYKLRSDIEHYESILKQKINQKVEIDRILDKIETPLRMAIINVYIKGNRVEDIARDMYLSHNGLYKQMNKAIMEALREI